MATPADFKRDGDKLVLYITEQDIWNNCHIYKTHYDYIIAQFKARGFEVTRLGNLDYMRGDSEITTVIEVHGTLGKNVREIRADEKT